MIWILNTITNFFSTSTNNNDPRNARDAFTLTRTYTTFNDC